jgi:hypothetical protein
MLKISTKLIFSLVIVSIMILTVGAVNMTENQTNVSSNNSNETITPIPTTVSTVTPIVTVTPNKTTIPNETTIPINENTTQTVNQDVNQNVTQNNNQVVIQNTNVTISAPISTEEKNTAINIAINFTINNIGIDNPKVLDVTRKEKDLRVRVKDNTGENIVLLISPKGDATEEVQNTPIFVETKSETQNSFVGKHVSFQFTNNSILNFTLEGKLIFTSINLGFNSTKVRNIGSTLRISDASNTVIVHDNPNGIITESSMNEINAIYTVTPDMNAEEISNKVDLSSPNIKGSIISSDTTMAAFALVAGDNISVTLNHDKTTFTARVLGTGSANEDDFEDRVVQGIHDKRIGTILNIDTENSHDVIGFGVDTTVNRVSRNTVSLNVNSDTPEGRTVVLRAGKDIFTNLNLRILVDGHEIPQAVDYNDLFKNDKLSYLLVIGQNVEVLVSIPQFSEHEIVVTSEPPEAVVTNTITPVPTVNNAVTSTVAPVVTVTVVVPAPTKAPGFTASTILVAMIVLFLLFRKNRG